MAFSEQYRPLLNSSPRSDDWTFFKRQFDNFLLISKADADQKLPLLLNAVGRDGLDIFDGLPLPKGTYEEATRQFNEYFSGRSSVLLRRKAFLEARQGSTESVTEFSCRLRRMIKDCGFPPPVSASLLRDIFVCGVFSNILGERLLAEDANTLTFELAIDKAEAFERARSERKSVGVHQIAAVSGESVKRVSQKPRSSQNCAKDKLCYRCGSSTHLANSAECPAKTATCKNCQRRGHFGKVCRQKSTGNVSNIRAVHEAHDSSDVYNIFACELPAHGAAIDVTRTVSINDHTINVIIDTGAECNVLPNVLPNLDISPTSSTVKAWGNFPLPVLGTTECVVRYGSQATVAKFYVIDVCDTSLKPLISLPLCKSLGLLSELVKDSQPHSLASVSPDVHSGTQAIVNEFADKGLFSGVGCIKNFEYKIKIDETIKPVSQSARRLPPALHGQIEKELNELCKRGVIKKVTEPTDWCAPIVVAKKRSGQLRICTDFRSINPAIITPHFQIPTFDELAAKVSGAQFFSILDATQAFTQISVHADSLPLLTFSSHVGRWALCRLPYGLKSSPEVFQSVLSDILRDVPRVLVYFDDILIAAASRAEHNSIIKDVMTRLLDAGVTLNREKCVFESQSVEFLGYKLSASGIAPSPAKIEAIQSMPLPETKEQLRSFLGLAGFVGTKFVPHYSNLAAPLFELCNQSQTQLSWKPCQQTAFESLKRAIIESTGLAWFDPSKPTTIVTDASSYALGCALMQNDKIVAFASRKLTPTECRYSQIEKEFLAIVFSLSKFRKLILGTKCEIFTDHKPILAFFKKPIDRLPIRIQKWIMHVQSYDIDLKFIEGRKNVVADAISRNVPANPPIVSSEENIEYSICFILTSSPLNLKDVAQATAASPLLQKVINAIETSWTSSLSKKLLPYYSMRDQLSIKHGNSHSNLKIICKGNLVVIPEELVSTILKQLHEGHLGQQKMKSIAQSCVYWPGFSKDINDYVRRCSSCTAYQCHSDKPPIIPVAETVTTPYHTVSVDLTGPSDLLKGKTLLTITDYYSRYPEAYILSRGTTSEILACLRQSFARFGIPKRVISDNGTPFVSSEFNKFLQSIGSSHSRSANYHPASNGLVERFHRTLKSRLKRLNFDSHNLPLEATLDKILYDIRSTPNAVTGETPYKRLFGRPMRTKFSELSLEPSSPVCPPRQVHLEYAKQIRSKVLAYQPGDLVFFRKCKGNPYIGEGIILNVAGTNSFRLKTNDGLVRTYNQCDIKPRFEHDLRNDIPDSDLDFILEPRDPGPPSNSTTKKATKSFSYNLRPRNIDPRVYKE